MTDESDRDGRFSRINEPLVTPREAAQLLSVRLSWIYSAVREGTLPCVRLGRHIRFVRPHLERWILDQSGLRR